jgi:hypothetical protein
MKRLNVEPMDAERFEQLTQAYGGESARWPQADRAPALRYLAATPAAHAMRARALRLDEVLGAWAPEAASAALRGRIAAGAPVVRGMRPRDLWISGVGLAAACVIGLMVGAGFGATGLGQAPAHEGDTAAANISAALDGTPPAVPTLDEGES